MTQTVDAPVGPKRPRLGEELPVFCEDCGYSLHGLPQVRCDHCELLYFRCPECGHRQPINTLRPAVIETVARLRAVLLAGWVFFKLNYFLWLLIAWVAMGYEWYMAFTRPYVAHSQPPNYGIPLSMIAFAFVLFALPFGAVSRMFLLRWRRGGLVGVVLATLVTTLVFVGALWRQSDLADYAYRESSYWSDFANAPLFTPGLLMVMFVAFATVLTGALIAWPIWLALVHLFLPARVAGALLTWQRGLSQRAAPALTR